MFVGVLIAAEIEAGVQGMPQISVGGPFGEEAFRLYQESLMEGLGRVGYSFRVSFADHPVCDMFGEHIVNAVKVADCGYEVFPDGTYRQFYGAQPFSLGEPSQDKLIYYYYLLTVGTALKEKGASFKVLVSDGMDVSYAPFLFKKKAMKGMAFNLKIKDLRWSFFLNPRWEPYPVFVEFPTRFMAADREHPRVLLASRLLYEHASISFPETEAKLDAGFGFSSAFLPGGVKSPSGDVSTFLKDYPPGAQIVESESNLVLDAAFSVYQTVSYVSLFSQVAQVYSVRERSEFLPGFYFKFFARGIPFTDLTLKWANPVLRFEAFSVPSGYDLYPFEDAVVGDRLLDLSDQDPYKPFQIGDTGFDWLPSMAKPKWADIDWDGRWDQLQVLLQPEFRDDFQFEDLNGNGLPDSEEVLLKPTDAEMVGFSGFRGRLWLKPFRVALLSFGLKNFSGQDCSDLKYWGKVETGFSLPEKVKLGIFLMRSWDTVRDSAYDISGRYVYDDLPYRDSADWMGYFVYSGKMPSSEEEEQTFTFKYLLGASFGRHIDFENSTSSQTGRLWGALVLEQKYGILSLKPFAKWDYRIFPGQRFQGSSLSFCAKVDLLKGVWLNLGAGGGFFKFFRGDGTDYFSLDSGIELVVGGQVKNTGYWYGNARFGAKAGYYFQRKYYLSSQEGSFTPGDYSSLRFSVFLGL